MNFSPGRPPRHPIKSAILLVLAALALLLPIVGVSQGEVQAQEREQVCVSYDESGHCQQSRWLVINAHDIDL